MWYTCKLPSANTETSLLLLLLFLLLSSSPSTVTYDYKWKLWPTRIEFIICWMHCNGSPYACFANVRMKYAVFNGVILFIFIIIIIVRSHCLSLALFFFAASKRDYAGSARAIFYIVKWIYCLLCVRTMYKCQTSSSLFLSISNEFIIYVVFGHWFGTTHLRELYA